MGDDQRVEWQQPVLLAPGGVGGQRPELARGLAEALGRSGVVALEEAEDAEGERVLGPVVGVAGLDPGAEIPATCRAAARSPWSR